MRGWVANWKRSSVERREGIYAKRWEAKDRDNLVVL